MVEQGVARIAFRNFAFIGPQSAPAGAAALAAGAQGRGWQFLELFYRNQGREDSGYADAEFLTAVAKGAGVRDIARWNQERESAKFTAEVSATTKEASDLGFTGTPSFALRGPQTNGLELLGTPSSSEEIEAAIEKAG
jgi:protein-disulfide isomerase